MIDLKKVLFFLPLLLVLLLCIPVILPYFHSGYFPTHDGEWAVVRLGDMFRELHDKQIPPRFSINLNFGYGYPLFNFAYPGPYYFAIIFYFLKFGFVNAIKITFALSVFVSAIGMYVLSKKIWKNMLAGIVSSLLYIYLPYRLVDLYVRGSIGESVAFAVVPFLFYAIIKLSEGKNTFRWIAVGALSLAALILSHNIMTVLFSIPLGIFALYGIFKKTKNAVPLISSLVLGFFLSAFFWLPALAEEHLIILSKIPIADRSLYFVTIHQLLFSPWGYGVPTAAHPFTYQMGIPQFILFLTAFGFSLFQFKKIKHHQDAVLCFILCLTTSGMSLLLFSPALFIWKYMPLLKEINYPWTLLGPLGFLMALIAGYVSSQKKILQYICIAGAVLAGILILPNAHPNYFVDHGDSYYLTNDATTTSSSELMPLWVKKNPFKRPDQPIEILNNNGTVTPLVLNSKKILFSLNLTQNSVIQINTIYYPGWKILVDGNPTVISYNNRYGVMQFNSSAGSHTVNATFGETPLRLAADIVSFIAFFVTIILLLPLPFFTEKNKS